MSLEDKCAGELVKSTVELLVKEASDRGLTSETMRGGELRLGGVVVFVRPIWSRVRWNREPTGDVGVTVFGVLDKYGQEVPTKVFRVGKNGLKLDAVFNHIALVAECIERKKRTDAAAVDAKDLIARKAAALDKLEAHQWYPRPGASPKKWQIKVNVVETIEADTLLELTELLP